MLEDDRWNDIYDLAEPQHGYFTTRQAEALGFARSTLHHHLEAGRIRRVLWGVYRLRNYPPSELEREAALTLWSADREGRPQAVVSHESALAHVELSDVLPAKIHLTVPKGFRKRVPADVEIHKADLPEDAVRAEGIVRFTTPIRTLLDLLGTSFSEDLLAQALVEGLDRGWIRAQDLHALEALMERDDPRRERAARLLRAAEVGTS